MKDGGRESTCMTRSWRFHGKRRTHQEVKYQPCGPVQTLSRRPKLPPAAKPPKNIFQKYPPENFQRPPRCRGGAVFATPPIPFGKQGSLAKQKVIRS